MSPTTDAAAGVQKEEEEEVYSQHLLDTLGDGEDALSVYQDCVAEELAPVVWKHAQHDRLGTSV